MRINVLYETIIPDYFAVGIKKDSENHLNAKVLLQNAGLNDDILFEHELCPGYVRLGIPNISFVNSEKTTLTHRASFGNKLYWPIPVRLSDKQKDVLHKVYKLYENDDEKRKAISNNFMELWNSHDILREITSWWNSINSSFEITAVGKALANANAKRIDPSLPDLN